MKRFCEFFGACPQSENCTSGETYLVPCIHKQGLRSRGVARLRGYSRGLPDRQRIFAAVCIFCINSLCHYIGKQTYSSRCSARDSWLMSVVTLGEGYHNYHHEFPYDYRNGVKPWQFEPTKWIIWTLSKAGLAKELRRVRAETILRAQLAASRARTRRAALGGRSVPTMETENSRDKYPVPVIIAINQHHTKMITTLISLLIAGLVLYVIYYVVGMFIKGQLLNIIGIILGLLFLLYALRAFHIVAI